MNEGIVNETFDGFDLKFIIHIPQNKTRSIISQGLDAFVLFK